MFVERTGHGPDLVLLHGWAMHGGIFEPLLAALRPNWTVHVVDLPGHGRSRDVATTFDLDGLTHAVTGLGLPPAVWAGWSLGGLVAQQLALTHPDRVRGLIAIASSPRFVRGPDWLHAVEPAVIGQFGLDLRQDWRATVERFLALETIGSEHARDDLRHLREQIFARGEPSAQVLSQGLNLLDSADLRAQLPNLAVPSLWIAGRRDRLVPWPSVQAAANLAGGRYLGIAGAGHAPFLQHGLEIADAIVEWTSEPRR